MTDAVHSAPPIRAQLFGGLMAFETSGGFRRLGSKTPGRERDSGAAVKPASTARNFALSHFFQRGFPQIPIMGVAAHLDSLPNPPFCGNPSGAIEGPEWHRWGSGGTRARAAEAIFGARSPAHPRPGASGAGRLAKFRIRPIFSQP